MSKSICAGQLAIEYLVKHPGFENRICYGDLILALRRPNGDRVPVGTAVQQRLNENVFPRGRYKVEKYEERGEGCIRRVWYWMTVEEARRIQTEWAAKRQTRKKAA